MFVPQVRHREFTHRLSAMESPNSIDSLNLPEFPRSRPLHQIPEIPGLQGSCPRATERLRVNSSLSLPVQQPGVWTLNAWHCCAPPCQGTVRISGEKLKGNICYNRRGSILGTEPPDHTLESASPSRPQGPIWHCVSPFVLQGRKSKLMKIGQNRVPVHREKLRVK